MVSVGLGAMRRTRFEIQALGNAEVPTKEAAMLRTPWIPAPEHHHEKTVRWF